MPCARLDAGDPIEKVTKNFFLETLQSFKRNRLNIRGLKECGKSYSGRSPGSWVSPAELSNLVSESREHFLQAAMSKHNH